VSQAASLDRFTMLSEISGIGWRNMSTTRRAAAQKELLFFILARSTSRLFSLAPVSSMFLPFQGSNFGFWRGIFEVFQSSARRRLLQCLWSFCRSRRQSYRPASALEHLVKKARQSRSLSLIPVGGRGPAPTCTSPSLFRDHVPRCPVDQINRPERG